MSHSPSLPFPGPLLVPSFFAAVRNSCLDRCLRYAHYDVAEGAGGGGEEVPFKAALLHNPGNDRWDTEAGREGEGGPAEDRGGKAAGKAES